MSTEEKLNQLRRLTAELANLGGIQALLDWDQQVNMPRGGMEDRSEQAALVAGIMYDRATSPQLGTLIEDLASEIPDINADDDLAREIKVAKRDFEHISRIPREKLIEFVMVTSRAHEVWVQARENNDFPSFAPHLTRIVELRREQAELFKPFDHPYDPLLDEYEPGMKTAEVKAIFDALRPQQVALLQRIAQAEQVDNSFIREKYDIDSQEKFGRFIATRMGYDWNRGRMDLAPHPFTTSFGYGDVRITTRYMETDGMSSLFSTMHETGHALYDQGLNPKYRHTSLGRPTSLAVHESQSRFWENLIGRSQAFWQFAFPIAQMLFPEHLGNLSIEQFYRGINRVEPSLIRIEADEATYNLHIMLRFEIETGLMEGKLETKDLPEIWNSRMQAYLGVTPPNDSRGVLQDVHWSGGMIGYFPTYALGNLISVQWWEKMVADHPNIPDEIASGDFSTVLAWMRENVHRYASRYDPQDLVQKITGSRITSEPYMRYLEQKYSQIYRL
ncbi:MAG TPA: carboxypeptidase [Anaerolineaceae bacterium]|nr:MAG: Carboxypeptidase Taq [Anaerolineae bacterium 49_20]HAE85385.1 carboxypeptidase [Anaerolineaceae bacterium]